MGPGPIDEAVAALLQGELVVFPTDTVYGIGAFPDDELALRRLFEAKPRPPELTLPVLVPSVAAARELAAFDDRVERLAGRWWPGALTIVLPRRERSRGWDLGAAADTVGVRMPHDPMALAVLAGTGPLAVTSANRSGDPTATRCDELVEAFGDMVAVYLCRDEPFEGTPSTVVDLASEVPRVLREGAIPLRELELALSG